MRYITTDTEDGTKVSITENDTILIDRKVLFQFTPGDVTVLLPKYTRRRAISGTESLQRWQSIGWSGTTTIRIYPLPNILLETQISVLFHGKNEGEVLAHGMFQVF